MAWYYGVYSCGHEGRVNIVGPEKDRGWKKDRAFSKLCPECYKKYLEEQREEKINKAKELSAEMELPELVGSSKQAAWANALRLQFVDKFDTLINLIDGPQKYVIDDGSVVEVTKEVLEESKDWVLTNKNDARFWIEARNNAPIYYVLIYLKDIEAQKNEIPEDIQEEINQEISRLIVSPSPEIVQKNGKNGIVEISLSDNTVTAQYHKDADFIEIVKSLGYRWIGVWSKELTEYTGTADNVMAQLGNNLLLHGFSVRFPNIVSRDMAINGTFEPECDRWIKFSTQYNKLSFSWKGRDNNIYENVMKLPSAKYIGGSVVVPVEFYREIIDFAETMNFRFSVRAKKEIEKYKQEESNFVVAYPKNTPDVSEGENLRKMLEHSGVIDDLRDDIDEVKQ